MTRVCKRFQNVSLDNYRTETEEQRRLVATLKDGVKNGWSKNIVIVGGVGTGKTHLAYSILNAQAEIFSSSSDPSICWYSEKKIAYRMMKSIIDEIKSSWNDKDISNPIYELSAKPLLIIDEIGVQYGTDSERTELYTLFNSRYEEELPIIAISNNDLPALQKILGQRIYDRLTGGAAIFELTGKSQRQEGGAV